MTISYWRLILDGLWHYRRLHACLALAVAAACSVLTGALVVGDSVTGSLRQLAIERLGRIDEVLVVDRFFRAELAGELQAVPRFRDHFSEAIPLIVLEASVTRPDGKQTALATGVTTIGCDDRFWELEITGELSAANTIAVDSPGDGVILNEPLASELGTTVGDEIVLRVPAMSAVAGDSFLGDKDNNTRGRRVRVSAIVPARGLGSFALRPSQQSPRCLFAPVALLQDMLNEPGKVNAIFVAGSAPQHGSNEEASDMLADELRPSLGDLGVLVERVQIGDEEQPTGAYLNVTSDRMMLPAAVVEAAEAAIGEDVNAQPVLTYLANVISRGDLQIPYSIVAGVESTVEIGPLVDEAGHATVLADDEIVLNRWAADDLEAQPGDTISLRFYEPESVHAVLEERAPPVELTLRAIVPLASAEGQPTMAADPDLVPELAGVTDQESIDDWDLPFPLVEEIRDKDETYWDDYRTTPKAFVSLATARRLWTSRFGDTTSIRIPASADLTVETIEERLQVSPADMGFVFVPVKRLALEASAGTTPFGLLFLGFSLFIVVAAVLLIAILFRLAIEQRASEVGVLAAVGFTAGQIRRVFSAEGIVAAVVGAALGILGGVLYAAAMLAGLRTLWLAAIVTPFVQLHVRPMSLVIGAAATIVVAWLTIFWSLRRLGRLDTVQLLTGRTEEPQHAAQWLGLRRLAWAALAAAAALSFSALAPDGEAQVGAFFVSGVLVLASTLVALRVGLIGGGRVSTQHESFRLAHLAVRNVGRNPTRTTLTMGLVGAASFLIVAIGAFRLTPSSDGAGGFDVIAESTVPVLHDMGTDDGRYELGFGGHGNALLRGGTSIALRTRVGDDASCLNLYRPSQPRLLGAPAAFVDRGRFAWADSAADTDVERANPWLLLDRTLESGRIPVVLDMNTALYSLHLMDGVGSHLEIDDGQGGTIRLEVVGLLKNSMFQGDVIMSEANLLASSPDTSGYRVFLFDTDGPTATDEAPTELVSLLETTLADYGFNAEPTHDRLARFQAVQNTYLSTFQSLGGLGLLLGTLGLATVQLRNVFERRGELALMQAAGFCRRRLAMLIHAENSLLVTGGMAAGVVSAIVAVLPHVILGGAGLPWLTLLGLLTAIVLVGLAAGSLAVRAALRRPPLESLRGR